MGILNARSSSFYFVFPRDFFPEAVTKKYGKFVKDRPMPYEKLADYINWTIQSISFPSLSIDTVSQVRNLGKQIDYKSSKPVQDLFSKEFVVNFRHVDGFTNYWLMLETVLYFLNFKNERLFMDIFALRLLDKDGRLITTVKFKEVLVTSFSELNLDYTRNAPESTSFSVGFKANYLDIDLEIG